MEEAFYQTYRDYNLLSIENSELIIKTEEMAIWTCTEEVLIDLFLDHHLRMNHVV